MVLANRRSQVPRRAAALPIVAASLLLLSACASGGASSAPTVLPESPDTPSVSAETPRTGYWPYDYGYGYGILAVSYGGKCGDGAAALQDSGTLVSPEQVDAYLQGCQDALAGRAPIYAAPTAPAMATPGLPAPAPSGPQDPSGWDACLDGTPGPWVVLWATQTDSGDITVTARCEQEAERFAKKELPRGVLIVDVFAI
jgi:hypothetical protein